MANSSQVATVSAAIKQFDNASANLKKLEHLWEKMERCLGSALSHIAQEEDAKQYDLLCLDFENIRSALPKIDGKALPNLLRQYYEVFQGHMDATDIQELSAVISITEDAYAQRRAIREYHHSLGRTRREFIRKHTDKLLANARTLLDQLAESFAGRSEGTSVKGDKWTELTDIFATLDRLLGDSAKRPEGWRDLCRHLHFGMKKDLDDIIAFDFPLVGGAFPNLLLADGDALPSDVSDLGELVRQDPKLDPVSMRIQWSNLSPEDFERLCQDIFATTPGWQNPKWLLHTRAPDRGRDIEVEKVEEDPLTGPSVRRTIVQCRHRPDGSVQMDELSQLVPQMELHGRVDLLIVITSGKFTDGVLTFVELHNKKDRLPVVQLWNDWNLERILAQRPDLTAQYGLL